MTLTAYSEQFQVFSLDVSLQRHTLTDPFRMGITGTSRSTVEQTGDKLWNPS